MSIIARHEVVGSCQEAPLEQLKRMLGWKYAD